MSINFDMAQRKVDNVLVIEVSGHLNSTTSPDFQTVVLGEISGGARRILIDCADLVYISSAGLRALIIAIRELKPLGGILGLSSLQDHLLKSLEVSGILDMFDVFEDGEGALAKMNF